jgi:hypothetical protein
MLCMLCQSASCAMQGILHVWIVKLRLRPHAASHVVPAVRCLSTADILGTLGFSVYEGLGLRPHAVLPAAPAVPATQGLSATAMRDALDFMDYVNMRGGRVILKTVPMPDSEYMGDQDKGGCIGLPPGSRRTAACNVWRRRLTARPA